jgi:uncharacterized membrane protein YedE/YeeE
MKRVFKNQRFFYFFVGFVFSLGLSLGGMLNPEVILSFLRMNDFATWNPSLLFVLFSAVALYALFYLRIKKKGLCASGCDFQERKNSTIDLKLIAGSAIFGIGWALSGICPAPAISRLGLGGDFSNLIFVIMMFLGFHANKFIFEKK